jgi:hypothetical protein
MCGEASDEVLEVGASEGPVEWLGDLVVVVLECVEALDDLLEAAEFAPGGALYVSVLSQ